MRIRSHATEQMGTIESYERSRRPAVPPAQHLARRILRVGCGVAITTALLALYAVSWVMLLDYG